MNNKGYDIDVKFIADGLRASLLQSNKDVPDFAKLLAALDDYAVCNSYLFTLCEKPLTKKAVEGVIDNVISVLDFKLASDYLRSIPYDKRIEYCENKTWRAGWIKDRLLKGDE